MSPAKQSIDTSSLFQIPDQSPPKPLAPPEYRQRALRFVINLNRSKGVDSMSLSELALQLRDQSLRYDIDPSFEPLSLASIDAAVADLVSAHELVVNDRTVVVSTTAG